ncbi:ATP-binding protein [Marispirochaeta aestuarii]|uniref:sensor histidine kinase n=1 Tax=Marispirochaeta aestuarii TaxID=1963862 RepID=UPI0029C823E4|nr:ATP-binding protein [Marispirochaeta aestuarii]
MKHRLFYTFLAFFALIIFLGAAVNIAIVAFSTHKAYTRMVRQEDKLLADQMALLAEDYYRQNGTLIGISEILRLPSGYGMPPSRRMLDHSRMMPRMVPPVLVLGEDGQVYADTHGFFTTRDVQDFEIQHGTPVMIDSRTVGRVFVGSMIVPALDDRDNEFLGLVVRSVLVSSLSVAIVAVFLGAVLFRRIASPVEALAAASRSIAQGNLHARINIHRSDELGELIDQFNTMASSLESSEEWKRRIISDSAHELRTPVAVLQGELEMILEGVYTPDRKRIESLYRETELMSRLISELGELAAAEGGQIRLIRQNCSLEELAREAAEPFLVQALPRKVSIQIPDTEGMEVFGDPQKIIQVIRNLVANALKVVPDGGRIDIYSEKVGNEAVLHVDDSGAGIPEEYREQIFQRFFRLDSSRNREAGGAGLGLAIARRIMQLHGGRIWADEGKNGGARISIALPLSDTRVFS